MTPQADEFLPTRRSLLSRLKDWDDQESWKDFFDTYWKLIYGVAIKSGLNDAEAQDVVQEAVISVAKKMHEFKYDPAVGRSKAGSCSLPAGASPTTCENATAKVRWWNTVPQILPAPTPWSEFLIPIH